MEAFLDETQLRSLSLRVNSGLKTRSAEVRIAQRAEDEAPTDDQLTVQAVLSTETPVLMPDYERMEMVHEVLLMSGMRLPKSRQVPLLDTHARWSIDNQKGSVRNILPEGTKSVGDLVISSAEPNTQTKINEDHLTDISVGYEIEKKVYVEAGQTKTIKGQEFTGPVNVVTQWRLFEASLCPIGADQLAKIRGIGVETAEETETRTLDNGDPISQKEVETHMENQNAEREQTPVTTAAPEQRELDIDALLESKLEKREAAKRQLVEEIRSACDEAGMSQHFDAVRDCSTVVEATRKLLKLQSEKQSNKISSISFGRAEADKFGDAVKGAILYRGAMGASTINSTAGEKLRTQAGDVAPEFRNARLPEVCRLHLERRGVSTFGMSDMQVVKRAMTTRDPSFNSSGDLSEVVLDAQNKVALAAYEAADTTFEQAFTRVDSVRDLKDNHLINLSGLGHLDVVGEDGKPKEKQLSNSKEKFRVARYANLVTVPWETMVNDDTGILGRIPAEGADAAKRTLNRLCYSVLTSNPTMNEDGVALFDATDHDNDITAGAAPNNTELSAMIVKLMSKTGLDGSSLRLTPKALLVPVKHKVAAEELLFSMWSNTDNKYQVYNAFKGIIPIAEYELTLNDADTYYLVANRPSVVYTYLQGQETPVIEIEYDFDTDGFKAKIGQTFGAGAADWRTAIRNDGDA